MKKLYIFTLIITLLITTLMSPLASIAATTPQDKKVVMLVMDYVDTSDLVNANTPHLDELIKQSGTGLMNIRAKNRYPSSSYMSIAVGYRVGTINRSEFSFNIDEPINNLPNIFETSDPFWTAGELYRLFTGNETTSNGIVNLYTENIRKSALVYNPSYEPGQIGKIARTNDLTITVLGNADTTYQINRDIALLGMDENGIVYQGNVSSNLLESDTFVLGGKKTNHEILLKHIEDYLPTTNLLIVDLGDTTRVESSRFTAADHIVLNQRKMAIERNDELIGRLLPLLNLESTMVLIITPNPNKEMVSDRNFGLTPVIIYDPTESGGLLTSATTRRSGLIANLDILPTIFSYLGADLTTGTTGVHINQTQNNSINLLDEELKLFKNLRFNRNPLHLLFMGLILLTFAIGLWTNRIKNHAHNKSINLLVNCILSIPILWMFISITNYESVINSFLFTIVGSLIIGGLLLLLKPSNALLLITSLTSLLLTIDCFTGSKLMLISPLGSDAIAGGRYYGVGNDLMGILLASSVIFITLLLYRLNIKLYLKTLIGLVFLLTVSMAIGHPYFGANVGGLITALVTAGVFVLLITNRKINLGKIAIVGILAIVGVIAVAQLDSLLSTNPSHAGKTVNSLLTGGYEVFFSIIRTKLGILANTVYTSSWSIVMIVSVALLIYLKSKFSEKIALLAIKLPSLITCIRILIVSGITVFIVNDTGVIASAFIFTYIISCLWIGFNEL